MAVVVQLAGNGALSDIFTWDESASSFSADRAGTAAFDYFTDDFTVDDAVYFGIIWNSDHFCALYFNVGTAIAATSYTLVWEYWDGDSWETIPTLTDDTNSFATTGLNYVHFLPPYLWTWTTINGAKRLWVRCRITAVDTPTEGGANATDTVKGKAAEIQISGGTEGTPATMEDVMAEATVTDWGLCVRETDSNSPLQVFTLHADLVQTDAGYFQQKSSVLNFNYGKLKTAASDLGATFIFGETESSLPRTGENGCFVMIGRGENDTGNIGYPIMIGYSTIFDQTRGNIFSTPDGCKFYGCSFNQQYSGAGDTIFTDCTLILLNTYVTSSGYVWTIDGGNFGHIYGYQNKDGFLARDITSIGAWSYRYNTKFVLYDCNVPATPPSYGPAGNWNQGDISHAYVHYTLTMTVQDQNATPIVGAEVDLKDKDGNLVQKWDGELVGGGLVDVTTLTTDANGEVTTDILHIYYKDEALVDDVVTRTTTTYSPITATITNAGYASRVIEYTMNQKRVEIEMMEKVKINPDQEVLI